MSKTTKNSATSIIAPKTAESKTPTQESRITVADFKRYIDSRDVKRVIYSTENQGYCNPECYDPFTPIKYELQFDGNQAQQNEDKLLKHLLNASDKERNAAKRK